MSNLQQEITDGMRADSILNDPLVRNALDGMRDQLKSGFSEQKEYNQDKAKEIWLALRVIDKFESALQESIETGKMASIEVERKSWLEQTKKRFL